MRHLPLLLLLAGCAESIKPDDTGEGDGSGSEVTAGEAWINATASSTWTYLDLAAGAVVDAPDAPEDSDVWDLGFQRQNAKINGGVSGTGEMEVSPLAGVDYNDDIEEPTDGWVTDEPDGEDDDELPEYALETWFEYDSSTHVLAPADITYVVRAVGGDLYKLRFLSYYDDAGTSGMIHLRWGPLSDSVEEDTGDTGEDTGGGDELACATDTSLVTSTTDDATGVTSTMLSTNSTTEYVCFDFATGQASVANDLAVMKWTAVSTAEVAELPGEDFDALVQAPADGYVEDDGSGSAMAGWYTYDAVEHTIDANDVVYVLHTTSGLYYKLQFTSYYPDGDTTQPHHPTFRWAEISAP